MAQDFLAEFAETLRIIPVAIKDLARSRVFNLRSGGDCAEAQIAQDHLGAELAG
jgi:hypothetical protein